MHSTPTSALRTVAFAILALGLLGSTGSATDLDQPVSTPQPETLRQEIVTLSADRVSTEEGSKVMLTVHPDTVRIHYSDDGQYNPDLPYQVRWVVAEPNPDWTVRIRPKDGEATDLFDFPAHSMGRPAFHIPGSFNTHPSGPVRYFPGPDDGRFDCREEETSEAARESGAGETHRICTWRYEVDLVDRRTGEVLATLDPPVEFEEDY